MFLTCSITSKNQKMKTPNPILVEITRGNLVESFHRGAVAVVDGSGELTAKWGDVDQLIYARSAIKPLQALPLIETGAADKFGLSDQEIALACSSHSAEEVHTDAVGGWLTRLDLGEANLECGACPPLVTETLEALYRAGDKPTQIHNNCSGKHTGMLTTARHLAEPTEGYIKLAHPVQQRIKDTLEEMMECDLSQAPNGIDGCGIPVLGMSLTAIATGMAKLASPGGQALSRKNAIGRISKAMAAHPYLVSGKDRFDTALMLATKGAVLSKGGAEGVEVAFVPHLGLGVALKIDDGARRGADVAMAAVLQHLGALDGAVLDTWLELPLKNWAGTLIGVARQKGGLFT
jgi:L-asparaginase II